MAASLREKMPASDKLLVLDVNTQLTRHFVDDDPQSRKGGFARTSVANNARELAERSVSIYMTMEDIVQARKHR